MTNAPLQDEPDLLPAYSTLLNISLSENTHEETASLLNIVHDKFQLTFNDLTKANGWGTMDPAVWHEQISLYSQLGQFSKRTPKLDEVMTMEILSATRDARAKV